MKPRIFARGAAAALAIACITSHASAQPGGDAQERIRTIVKQIAEEMQEIDRLLLQSGTSEALRGLDRNVRRIDELLKQSSRSQGDVVRGIEELIKQIESMPPSGGGGQGDDERQDPSQRPDQQSGGQQRPGQQQNRIETPDMVRQGQRQGQQQQDQQQQQQGQQGQQPRDPHDDRSPGQQRPAGAPPPADGTEQVEHGGDAARWGTLPQYLQFVQSRGGLPEVPEKYRKLYEAYTRQGAKRTADDDARGGASGSSDDRGTRTDGSGSGGRGR